MIESGYVDTLLAGNALAVHDIESALFGTSLDCQVRNKKNEKKKRNSRKACSQKRGMHMRAINRIRAAGSIENAVEKGILNRGIMYETVKNNVDYILAGSIRDDGPLPETIKDTLEAQEKMKELARRADMVFMLATMLHSIATGNMLPASTKTVCVDINSDAVTKLSDRGSSQAIGLITDVEFFLDKLTDMLDLE